MNFNLNATSTENILISKSGINTENKGDKHEGEITKIFFRFFMFTYTTVHSVCTIFQQLYSMYQDYWTFTFCLFKDRDKKYHT